MSRVVPLRLVVIDQAKGDGEHAFANALDHSVK